MLLKNYICCLHILTVPDNSALDLAAKEALLVYHTVKENQTLSSTTCMSLLIRKYFGNNPSFTCAKTKSDAILSGTIKFKIQIELDYFKMPNFFRRPSSNVVGNVEG